MFSDVPTTPPSYFCFYVVYYYLTVIVTPLRVRVCVGTCIEPTSGFTQTMLFNFCMIKVIWLGKSERVRFIGQNWDMCTGKTALVLTLLVRTSVSAYI